MKGICYSEEIHCYSRGKWCDTVAPIGAMEEERLAKITTDKEGELHLWCIIILEFKKVESIRE